MVAEIILRKAVLKMKTFVKGLAALMICGTLLGVNCDTAEASEVADLTTDSIETEDLARHNRFPPPPPPRHDRHRHDNFGYNDYEPPPPPPPHYDRHRHEHRPHFPPHHRW